MTLNCNSQSEAEYIRQGHFVLLSFLSAIAGVLGPPGVGGLPKSGKYEVSWSEIRSVRWCLIGSMFHFWQK